MPAPTDTLARPVRPDRAPRHDGWTRSRKRLFFETLAAGHSVAWACVRAGLSRQAAYKARRRDPAFARQWQAAQESARRAAEQAFLDGLPENLLRALSETATPGQLREARFLPLDTVRFVKRM